MSNIQLIDTKVYAGRLKDHGALMNSSSGGAFTAISDVFLQQENIVLCSVYNYDTCIMEYQLITTTKERNAARGSKYIQSRPGNIFREATSWLTVNPDKTLLFVGMGCQAEGFRKYTDSVGLRDRVTIVDIICHGASSPMLWKEYAVILEKSRSEKITYLTFKDKRNGWMRPTAVAMIGGKEISLKEYIKVFYNRCTLRPSCHECPFATTERKTDLTIGDFWGIEEKIPDFYDEMGNSLFLIHTNRGVALFDSIKQTIDYRESNTIDCWQKNLEHPTPVSPNRQEFWQDYQKYGVKYIMKKYGSDPFMKQVKNKIKRIIGGGVLTDSTCHCDYVRFFERRVA